MVVAGLILGLAIGSHIGSMRVSAGSSFAVHQQAPHPTPYQDERLALTYARLLPREHYVVQTVAKAAELSPEKVRSDLSMTAEPETNIVFVRFSSHSLGKSLAALNGFADAVQIDSDAAGTPLRKSMRPISLPNGGIGFTHKKATLLGGAVGLLIAVALALACEGRLPRVDDLERLGELLSAPVSQVSLQRLGGTLEQTGLLEPDPQLGVVAVGGARFGSRVRAVAGASGFRRRQRSILIIRRGAPVIDVEEGLATATAAGDGPAAAFLVTDELRTALPWRLRRVKHGAG
jgi:hypothetical protein